MDGSCTVRLYRRVRQALVAHQPPDDDSCLDLAPDEWQTSFRHLHQRISGLALLRTDRVLSDEVVLTDPASAARDYWLVTRFQAYGVIILLHEGFASGNERQERDEGRAKKDERGEKERRKEEGKEREERRERVHWRREKM